MAIDIRLYFDCTNKKTFIKDLTNYTTEIPSGVDVTGYGTLSAPNSTLIINANSVIDPIINSSADPRISSLYNLTSPIQAGQYILNYTNFYEYVTLPELGQKITILTNNSLLVPGELADLFTVGDSIQISNSDDSDNNGTYTITASENEFGNTVFTINANTLVPLDPIGQDDLADVSITKTSVIYNNQIYTYSVCSSTPTPCVEFSYDCFTGAYGSGQITDATNYTGYTVETRELSAYYPNALDPAPAENPVITETAIININELATGTWSVKLSSTVSSQQADGLNLQSTITTLKEFNVACSSNMCGLSDCLTKLKDKHISYLKSSNISPLQQYVDNVQLLYTMAKEAQACGDKNAYSDYVSQIYAVLKKTESDCGCSTGSSCGCGCESSGSCGCGDQTPQWINNIGIDVNSLLEDFEIFMNDTLPTLEANIDSLNNDMEAVQSDINDLQSDVIALNSGLSTVTTETGNNTTSIDALDAQINTPVTGLAAQVELLQEEIAGLGASNSEVALNELFNELPTTNQGVWIAYNGIKSSPAEYFIYLTGNQTSLIPIDTKLSFYNPPSKSWFYGNVNASNFVAGNTILRVQEITGITYTGGCTFEDSTEDFPVYICSASGYDSTEYNFTKSFSLENDAYWQYSDVDNKYWSKLNVSLIHNDLSPIVIANITTEQTISIRPYPGYFVDIEITFEKFYNVDKYDLATVVDINYIGIPENLGVDGEYLQWGGWSGVIPGYQSGLNLTNMGVNNPTNDIGLGSASNVSSGLNQDVYDGVGTQTTKRVITRYANGANGFPLNTAPMFFSGNEPNEIIFNSSNSNITIFKFEQSFGRFAI
jgi:hypothetical protein